MTRHVLFAGRLDGIGHDSDSGDELASLSVRRTDGIADLDCPREVAAAIAADGLLFADVELTLSRAGDVTPAEDERRRYLAECERSTHLERVLADAEQTVRELRAEVAGDGYANGLRAALDAIAAVGSERERLVMGGFNVIEHVAREVARLLHPQPPHRPAADVERVVVGEGRVRWFAGRWSVTADVRVGDDSSVVHLPIPQTWTDEGQRVRVLVERVDAEQRVADQRGEGVGQRVGGEHRDGSIGHDANGSESE